MMSPRKSLADILRTDQRESLASAWNSVKAAEEFAPLPGGEYVARVESGELFASKENETPGYKLKFRVLEGEHAGRLFWHDLWLTKAAIAMTKRNLFKLGVTSPDQLDRPLPQGIVCRVKLALPAQKTIDGNSIGFVHSRCCGSTHQSQTHLHLTTPIPRKEVNSNGLPLWLSDRGGNLGATAAGGCRRRAHRLCLLRHTRQRGA